MSKSLKFKLVSGVLRQVDQKTIKQEIIPTCDYDQSGSVITSCNKKETSFAQASLIDQTCSGLNGECDPTVGLTCQLQTSGIRKCS